MKRMVLDGNSILNRAYYGIRPLTTRQGLYTHAIYGFLTTLQRLVDEEHPDALCVTFDRKAPTFRHLAYAGYKAQRKGMPEELAMQLPYLKDVLDAMGIRRYELDGWEADDLLGTIAARDSEAGWETVIVTGDKDSLQLIDPSTRVKLVSTRMGQTTTRDMTEDAFREQYGFEPIHLIDLKALMGDSSDNIPGVKGIGEKTAMELIGRYGSIDRLYEHLSEDPAIKPAARKKLEEGQADARMSWDLARIRRNAPVAFQPEEDLDLPVDRERLYDLFLQLEFSKFIEKMNLQPAASPADTDTVEGTCSSEVVCDAARARELMALWRTLPAVNVLMAPDGKTVAVDCELNPQEHLGVLFLSQLLPEYPQLLQELMGSGIRKRTHDLKTLLFRLLQQGIRGEDFITDTALAGYLLAPTDGSYELEKLGLSWFNQEFPHAADYLAPDAFGPLADFERARQQGADPFADAPDGAAAREAGSRPMGALLSHCSLVEALSEVMEPKLRELGMEELYRQVELPLCPVLADMEQQGMLIDGAELEAFGQMLDSHIREMEQQIYDMAGGPFNIQSPKQLGQVLFEQLQLPHGKKTKTGWSTNADVLDKLRHQHPIVAEVLSYRQYSKLKSTYADGLLKVMGPDGRIHTSFQNTVTATGRLSSTEPNLQNIPVRTELGAALRKMFVAPEGWVLVDADYSQIELRLLAHISDDQHMIQAFRDGEDIHTATAAQVFGVAPKDVTAEMRRRAKAVNFGIVYGISEFSLAQDIGVSRQEAKDYMERYFARYSGVRAYMDRVVEEAKANGYVATLMGRRRWLPELQSSNFNLRSFGERVALNMPIQGTAADIIKLAMVRVHRRLREEGLQARLILQVHDELIVECPQQEAETVQRLLEQEMEQVVALKLPLIAQAHAGKSWAQAKE